MSRPEDTPITFEDEPTESLYVSQPFPLVAWWNALDGTEQGLYGGLGLMSAGLAAAGAWPVALIVSGAALAGLAIYTVTVIVRRGGR